MTDNKTPSKPKDDSGKEVVSNALLANFYMYKGRYKNINGSTIHRNQINKLWYLRDKHKRIVDLDKNLSNLTERNGLLLS